MKPVVAIDAHKESCTYVVRHWEKTLAGPKRIPSTTSALTKLARTYQDHEFVIEVCSVHFWSPAHGDTAFTVPLFDEFMKREMPEWPSRSKNGG